MQLGGDFVDACVGMNGAQVDLDLEQTGKGYA